MKKTHYIKHALKRAIKRVEKVKNYIDAINYLNEKFYWMLRADMYKYRKVHKRIVDNGRMRLTNWFHVFIYEIERDRYKIITYIRNDKGNRRRYSARLTNEKNREKNKNRKTIDRIEKLFIK